MSWRTNFTEMHCGECGIEFAVPDHFYKERLETGKGWTCPNGHNRVFRETTVKKLERERDSLKQQIARVEDEKREAITRAEAAETRERRLKKRASAGVCPCCNRTFQQLARHMNSKHPTFTATPATVVPLKRKRNPA